MEEVSEGQSRWKEMINSRKTGVAKPNELRTGLAMAGKGKEGGVSRMTLGAAKWMWLPLTESGYHGEEGLDMLRPNFL